MFRPTFRLLKPATAAAAATTAAAPATGASIAPTFIAPFSPTGLAGLHAHPTPRPALIAVYNTTLLLLSTLPSHFLYRQSATNLTKHRLSLVNSVLPLGYSTYQSTVLGPLLPDLQMLAKSAGWPETKLQAALAAAQVQARFREITAGVPDTPEGVDLEALHHVEIEIKKYETAMAEAVDPAALDIGNSPSSEKIEIPMIASEPPLSAEQVAELEGKLEAGLIEEVINQAVAEMHLVKKMREEKPWEQLIEEPVKGQWEYFERKPPAAETTA